ncbi:hypothetical protein GEV33_009263 [Tenebrio molitor]|uniref:Major facilitator superfamily (MFS) profile domain-containing protein n=1 Tax=Tenebrio molitor TaxID=7067 RepID=A0A8J6HH31_TENMO|nr:hypothetical protein GEV33_009263 [Tenebrio molitor]
MPKANSVKPPRQARSDENMRDALGLNDITFNIEIYYPEGGWAANAFQSLFSHTDGRIRDRYTDYTGRPHSPPLVKRSRRRHIIEGTPTVVKAASNDPYKRSIPRVYKKFCFREDSTSLTSLLDTLLTFFDLLATSGDITMTWTSPIFSKLYSNDSEVNPFGKPITTDEDSWIGSLINIGAMIGPFPYGFIGEKYGRKIGLLAISIPHIISYLTLAFSRTVYLYYFARLLGGIAVGGGYTLLPMYVAEVAEDSNREGRLREQLRAQHSVRSDGSSENKQIPAQSEFQFPDSNKVHSPVKILIGDKTLVLRAGFGSVSSIQQVRIR